MYDLALRNASGLGPATIGLNVLNRCWFAKVEAGILQNLALPSLVEYLLLSYHAVFTDRSSVVSEKLSIPHSIRTGDERGRVASGSTLLWAAFWAKHGKSSR